MALPSLPMRAVRPHLWTKELRKKQGVGGWGGGGGVGESCVKDAQT